MIEALVLLFIFAVVSLAFFESYTAGTRLIIESKNRLGATALANQKMEIIRSLDYDNIGTESGIPSGDIPEYETVSVNTRDYQVHTFVQYVDDTFDGKLGSNPTDAIPADYKLVRLEVAWGDKGPDQTVVVFANFSPAGIETSAGGGTFSINILDKGGVGVAGVSVHIVNNDAGVNVTIATDSTGNITLPGAPAGTQNYQLTVSKSGYYGVVTYPPYPASIFNPVDEHASVVNDVVNPKSITMDQYADITIHSKDAFGADVPNIDFSMKGGKVLGTNPDTNGTEYGYNQNLSTNASGVKDIQDQSYGQYTLTVSDARYQFYKLSPEGAVLNTFDALPGQTNTIDMTLLDTEIGSLKVAVINASDNAPVAGATAHLVNSLLGYDVSVTTDQYGLAYFPTALPALADGNYDLEVSASGFSTHNSSVSINGSLITKNVALNP